MERRGLLARLLRTRHPGDDPHPGAEAAVAAANALTVSWARTHRDGNVVLSGLGCWVLLATLASAAHGRARTDLESAVGIRPDRALEAAMSVLEALHDIDAVHAALGVWSRAVLDPEWTGRLRPSVTGELTGDPDADQRRIDEWVAQATGHELHALPIDLSSDTRLILASALTVRTEWAEPFDTWSGPEQGRWADRPVSWLTRSTRDLGDLRVAQTPVGPITWLRVPGQGEVDVHLVRGEGSADAGSVLAAGIGVLGGQDDVAIGEALPVGSAGPGVQVERVTSRTPGDRLFVDVPAFAVHASHDLLRHKEIFGLESATDDAVGHFPGMSAEPLAVGQAAQDATAEFSTTGFRAAAVTAVEMLVGSAPNAPSETHEVRHVKVVFDQPFGFVAVHAPTSLVLAAGWVDDPSSGATPAAPGSPA